MHRYSERGAGIVRGRFVGRFFISFGRHLFAPVTKCAATIRQGAALSLLFVFLAVVAGQAAAEDRHLYDENGRLTATLGDNGDYVVYQYDAAGNRTATLRISANGVLISQFAPVIGPVGTQVVLTGTGFSATPSENVVKFDGVNAVVSNASTTQLTVTVPSGATTGPITVTTSSGTAISPSVFTVGFPPPAIASFTPNAGTAGVAVTVTGEGFDTAANATTVKFNQSSATITAISPTSLTVTAPSSTGSGKIKVTTNRGTATSTEDFIYLPSGVAAADIVARQRISVGGAAQAISITTANKYGVVLFDGEVDDLVTINVDALSTSPAGANVAYSVYRPNGTLLTSGNVTTTVRSVHLPKLTIAGTHSIFFRPVSATGNLTVSATGATTLTADVGSSDKTISISGQSVRFAFNVTQAGQNVGFGITGLTLSPSGSTSALVHLYTPTGTMSGPWYCNVSTAGCGISWPNLSTAGTYTVTVTPLSAGTGSFTALVSNEVNGTLGIGAPAVTQTTRAGQNARLAFYGTSGQQLGLAVHNVTLTGNTGGANLTISVIKPDGNALVNGSVANGGTSVIDIPVLPTTGTYTIFYDVPNTATASFNTALSADVIVPLNLDGTASNVTLIHIGQTARLTFTGTAGQEIGVGLTNLSLTPNTTGSVTITEYRPDGGFYSPWTCAASGANCGFSLQKLPQSGTYTFVVTPPTGNTGSFTFAISSEVTGTITVDTPLAVQTTRPGQNARFSFNGTAGQQLGLAVTDVTLTGNTNGMSLSYGIYKPDGTALSGGSGSVASGGKSVVDPVVLPVTGTYTILFDPPNLATTSLTATLSTDVAAALTLDGTPTDVTLALPGQTARLTFDATTGQNLGLGIGNLTLTGATGATVYVFRPNGTQLTYTSCAVSAGGCVINLTSMPVTGTYSVVVVPANGGTGSFAATLSSEVGGALVLNTPYSLSIPRNGQNARLTFSGTIGQHVVLNFASVAINPAGRTVAFYVYRPDTGAQVGSAVTTGSNTSITISSLPVTGEYKLFVDPFSPYSASMTVTLNP